jgi:hypothetical protein
VIGEPPTAPTKPGWELLQRYKAAEDPARWEADRQAFLRRFRGRHAGDTLVLLGTGPSISTLELECLHHFTTIGANGIGHVYHPTYYLICDPFIYGLHQEVFLGSPSTRILTSFTAGECDVWLYYRREDAIGLDREVIYHAENTGYVMLSMAYVMGATRIAIAGYDGYDLSRPGDRFHCYPEEDVEVQRVRYEWQGDNGAEKTALMRRGFEYARHRAESDGVEIVLLTSSWFLGDLFPMASLPELARGCR